MTAPLLPSWHWDKETQTIEMWARWSDAPPDASVSGPVAAMLVDVLSWTYEQTRLPDPQPSLHARRRARHVPEGVRLVGRRPGAWTPVGHPVAAPRAP